MRNTTAVALNLFQIQAALQKVRRDGIGIEDLDAGDVFAAIEGLEKLLQAVAVYNPEQARELKKLVEVLDEVAGTVQDINIEDNM
jgi:hypothetical protein